MKQLIGLLARYAVQPFPLRARRNTAREIAGENAVSCPSDLLRAAKARGGLGGFALACAILFGWCLLAACALDFLLPVSEPVREALGALCCCAAFGCCTGDFVDLFLKFCFVLLTMVYRGEWTSAVAFLIAYEIITASLPAQKGASRT